MIKIAQIQRRIADVIRHSGMTQTAVFHCNIEKCLAFLRRIAWISRLRFAPLEMMG